MKTLSRISFVFILVALLASCKGDKSKAVKAGEAGTKATATEASKTYSISPAESTILWVGSKTVGESSHSGTIKVQNGSFTAEGDKITSGTFIIDMNSLATNDFADNADMKGKLEGHLKSADFFEVEKYATAVFNLTSAKPLTGGTDTNYTISGNLTLKGVEKEISFPAQVAVVGGKIMATAPSFAINRTDWGVKYGSGNFFKELTADKVINDDIKLTISLVGNAPVAQ